jgi:anti-sigma regulatory factor (Ser/Thr protein kinase)
MQRMFKRSFDSLAEILVFTNEFFGSLPADPATRYAIDLAIDELFSNMVKYNSHSPADIGVAFARNGATVSVTLIDYESEPFDITKARPVDINLPAQDRAIGGLGIHLVHQMVDTLRFEHSAGVSTIEFTKTTGKQHV